MLAFVNRVLSDNAFNSELKSVYAYYRRKGTLTVDNILRFVDDYAAQLDESQKLNFIRWKTMTVSIHQNPLISGSFKGEVDRIRTYINTRLAWLDNKLEYKP